MTKLEIIREMNRISALATEGKILFHEKKYMRLKKSTLEGILLKLLESVSETLENLESAEVMAEKERETPNPRVSPMRHGSNHDNLCPICHKCGGIVFVDPWGDLRCSCRNYSAIERGERQNITDFKEVGGAVLQKKMPPVIDIGNPMFLSRLSNYIETWIKENSTQWRWEDDSFAYSYGSINSCHKAGHREFDPPAAPLKIEIAGYYPCYSHCIEEEIFSDAELVRELGLSEICPDNLKITAGIKQHTLTVELDAA